MFFSYTGIDKDQKEINGTIEANTIEEAKSKLENKIIILNIKKLNNNKIFSFLSKKEDEKFIYLFTEDLYSYLNNNINIKIAINLIKEKKIKLKYKNFLNILLKELSKGNKLTRALKKQNIIYIEEYYLETIKIGENYNNLTNVLKELINYLENKIENKNNILQALTYPLIVLTLSIFVLGYMLIEVFPKIIDMFQKNNQELPELTQIILNISNFLINNYLLLSTFILIIFILNIYLYKNNNKFKETIHKILLKLPLYKDIIQNKELTNFLYLLHLLLKVKIQPNKALLISKNIISNIILKKEFEKNLEQLKNGITIEEAFKKTEILNKDFLNFIYLSDYNNTMKETSFKLSKKLEKTNKQKIKKIITYLEPLTMLFVGTILGIIIISILLPIFTLNIN